jgi:FAD/FMN-containing dehydrogenase
MDDLTAALIAELGADAVIVEGDDLAYYGADRCRGDWPVAPRCIVFPNDVDEVRAIVRACAAAGVSIVPSGGRTGLAGAATATAGEVVVSLERMRRILEVDAAGMTLRCEAGATVEAVQLAAAEHGLLYPIDFAAKGSAHIGGSIATNAGGVKVIRYGMTREWVLGLRAVVASGDVLDVGGPLVKDNTGYDLRQLFIGAEGTLGIVVEATLRLCTPPADVVVALCAVPDEPALLALLSRVRTCGATLAAFECFDAGCLRRVLEHRGGDASGPFHPASPQHALIEVEVPAAGDAAREHTVDALTLCLADAQDEGTILDAVVAASTAQARDLWALREDVSESLHRHHPHKSDISVPVARLAEFIVAWRAALGEQLPGVEGLVFGHIGDGNLHLNLLAPEGEPLPQWKARAKAFDTTTYGLVARFAGSISAEHGVGLLKREHLHLSRSDVALATMRAIKHALDPAGLFNPGKIFV